MKKYRTGLLVLLAIIIVFIGSLSFVSFSGAFSSDKKIDGIEDVAIKFDDFEIPKDVKVVGIGEATHGNKELQIIKREILEKVVKVLVGHKVAVVNERKNDESKQCKIKDDPCNAETIGSGFIVSVSHFVRVARALCPKTG